jgi:glycosyltransferase involved in cell wall biosynthesis
MENFPFITILTASLNSETSIRKTIESIRNQSFQDLEHIVIDGGSHDETLMILKQNEKAYNLTWISEPDHGISDALNKGLRLARGRYILVLHADDQLLTPEILKGVYLILKSERFDIYSFPVLKDYPDKGKILYKPVRILWWHHFKTIFPHQGAFVHQRLFTRAGGFREEFTIALDYNFFYRGLQTGARVKFEKQPVALVGGTGISSNPILLVRRLQEEFHVQKLNERNPFWQIAQFIFRAVYFPYKTRFLPKLTKRFGKGKNS